MASPSRFCGQCGARITDEQARFCGECGASLAAEAPEHPKGLKRVNPVSATPEPDPQVRPSPEAAPESPPSPDAGFAFQAAIAAGWQTSLAWLIGWLPIGYFFSNYYAQKQILNPQWYEQYPLGFDATFAGMTIMYSSGALIGGFLAGFSLYLVLGTKDLTLNGLAAIPAVGWLLLMGVSMWGLTFPVKSMDDGTLLIAVPVMAVLYGALLAWLTLKALSRKHDKEFSTAKIRSAAIGWGVSGFASFFIAMIVAEFFE